MPNYTTHYNLIKPLGTDAVSIIDLNDNMDTIDANMRMMLIDTIVKSSTVTTMNIPLGDIDFNDYAEIKAYFTVSANSSSHAEGSYSIANGDFALIGKNNTTVISNTTGAGASITNVINQDFICFGDIAISKYSNHYKMGYSAYGYGGSSTSQNKILQGTFCTTGINAVEIFLGDVPSVIADRQAAILTNFEIKIYGILR